MTTEERMRRIIDELMWGLGVTITEYNLREVIKPHLKEAIEEEREACAKICEEYAKSYWEIVARPGGSAAHYAVTAGNKCADKIRNRKGIDR